MEMEDQRAAEQSPMGRRYTKMKRFPALVQETVKQYSIWAKQAIGREGEREWLIALTSIIPTENTICMFESTAATSPSHKSNCLIASFFYICNRCVHNVHNHVLEYTLNPFEGEREKNKDLIFTYGAWT